jgi:hypothetical protein
MRFCEIDIYYIQYDIYMHLIETILYLGFVFAKANHRRYNKDIRAEYC